MACAFIFLSPDLGNTKSAPPPAPPSLESVVVKTGEPVAEHTPTLFTVDKLTDPSTDTVCYIVQSPTALSINCVRILDCPNFHL
jgi:hypothetical protein